MSGPRKPASTGTVDEAARAAVRVWRRCEFRLDPRSGELAVVDGNLLLTALDVLQAACRSPRRRVAAATLAPRTSALEARVDRLEGYSLP